MKPIDSRHLLIAVVAVAAIALTGLWAWNTVAELFGLPPAQLRHVVASAVLLTLLRALLLRPGHGRRRGPRGSKPTGRPA